MQNANTMTAQQQVQSILDTLNAPCIPSPDVDPDSWEKWLDSFKMPRFCKRCGGVMVLREGRRGRFYGCSAWPKCNYAEDE